MRYIMREKLFAWGDDFTIRNEHDQDTFFVDGKVFTLGDQLSVQDMHGNELAQIHKRYFTWMPTYELYRHGQLYATINEEAFTFFRCTFTVDVPGPNDIIAEGDFFDHEYTFERNGHSVAIVSKRWFSFVDTYGIDIADQEDPVLILASAVVIDLICHDKQK